MRRGECEGRPAGCVLALRARHLCGGNFLEACFQTPPRMNCAQVHPGFCMPTSLQNFAKMARAPFMLRASPVFHTYTVVKVAKVLKRRRYTGSTSEALLMPSHAICKWQQQKASAATFRHQQCSESSMDLCTSTFRYLDAKRGSRALSTRWDVSGRYPNEIPSWKHNRF